MYRVARTSVLARGRATGLSHGTFVTVRIRGVPPPRRGANHDGGDVPPGGVRDDARDIGARGEDLAQAGASQ